MSTITLRIKSTGLIIIWIWVGEDPVKTFTAAIDVLTAAEDPNCLNAFGRRECVECKAKVLAMA